ncbi:MAG TPA: dicarboxylate/amino acid:cation symporter [Vicinamibacterales bacterium]|nr:dicarboxylate/amino acid:cation symporter [Vicinamibacterales bacterium]
MSLTARVLAGLVAGFLVGLAAPVAVTDVLAPVLGPLGALFINLIRVSVIPLVVSILVASIGRIASSRAVGRAGARAVALALTLLTIAAVGSALVAAPILNRIGIDRTAVEALQRAQGQTPRLSSTPTGTAVQWFVDLIPPNVFHAVDQDAMLPVIVVAVLFALALARVRDERRMPVLQVVEGISEAMQKFVGAVLELAPFGVFALAVPLAARLGAAAAAAVGAYIVLVVVLTVAASLLLLYPLGIVGGRMAPGAFASFCAPAQAVAFSSRSSLAALPAMLETVEHSAAPPVVAGFVLPLAASVFRFGAAIAQTVGALFLARLYGIVLSPAELAAMVVAVIFATFAVPGIPGGSVIAMVPVLRTAGIPVDGIGILLAVDAIPDMFRTTANVTGTMAVAAALSRVVYDDRDSTPAAETSTVGPWRP